MPKIAAYPAELALVKLEVPLADIQKSANLSMYPTLHSEHGYTMLQDGEVSALSCPDVAFRFCSPVATNAKLSALCRLFSLDKTYCPLLSFSDILS